MQKETPYQPLIIRGLASTSMIWVDKPYIYFLNYHGLCEDWQKAGQHNNHVTEQLQLQGRGNKCSAAGGQGQKTLVEML